MNAAVRLQLVPITLKDATEFVAQHHRHHGPPRGGLFAVAAAEQEAIVGVAVVGRPVARPLQDGFTAEVTRVAVLEHTRNACSLLYGACWRACRAMGYRRLITYTLESEPGTSLRAAGWREVGRVTGRSWHTASRPRVDHAPLQDKIRWQA